MRAAIYNPYWDTLGGGERYTASFIKLLLDAGWPVDIWWPENIASQIFNRFAIDISQAKYTSSGHGFGYDLAFFVSDGSLPVSFAGRTVIHLQFPFTHINGRSLANIFKSRFYQFVVNSAYTKQFIDKEFAVSSKVVYPPVSVSSFQPGQKKHQILYVGRFSNLTQSKGHGTLINEFAKVQHLLPGWKLILAGGTGIGSDKHELELLKNSAAGLPVEFIFNPDFPVLQKLYAQSTFYWSASGFNINPEEEPLKVEHFGISLVEAMAAGCVPVVTGVGGHLEIIENDRSGLFWTEPGQLGDLTLQLLKDKSRIKSISLSAVTRSKMFSVDRFNSRVHQILKL